MAVLAGLARELVFVRVVVLMAGDALQSESSELRNLDARWVLRGLVAAGTRSRSVFAGQGEPCLCMVEDAGRTPRFRTVTIRANRCAGVGHELSSVRVVADMASLATLVVEFEHERGRIRLFRLVAGETGRREVGAGKREAALLVMAGDVIRGWIPAGVGMAIAANGAARSILENPSVEGVGMAG